MDVGLVVNFNGLIATAFAFLAGMALAVELGSAPKKKSEIKQSAKNESTGKAAHRSRTSRRNGESPDRHSTDNENAERLMDDAQADESRELEKTLAVTQPSSSEEAIHDLQRTYVDGLLAPRIKYDVALAILSEYQSTSVSEEESGLLMATQAYLSATRTGSLTSGAFSLVGMGTEQKQAKKKTEEVNTPNQKSTKELSTRKTGDRGRPARSNLSGGQDGASKKTTTGDYDSSGQPRGTARNTNRKNTRPE